MPRRNSLVLILSICLLGALSITARAETTPANRIHALIMTIGAYQGAIPPLSGVKHDAETARQIAHRMGVPDANIRILRDRELSLDGMRRAFDELLQRVAEGDQVFIYYSGHGGRQLVKEPGGGERCAESLVTIDGYGLIDTELEAQLKRLSQKAQKVIAFLDACHSGGATTRAIGAKSTEFTSKYWSGSGGAETCAKPTNLLTRNIAIKITQPGTGGGNYVYISAARDTEISFDQAEKGGIASRAWLECMAGAAQDADGSGGLSADEIRVCAQTRIDDTLKLVEGITPAHVSITGNAQMVMNYSQPASGPAQFTASAAAAGIPPLATLNDIHANRDDRRLVQLTTGRPSLRIGRDALDFSLFSREEGYVYLLMVGSDGQTFDLLFPNRLDRENFVRAGETLRLPRATWQLKSQGPAGKNTLLAIVSDAPRDFAKLGLQAAGPFSNVAATAVTAKDIQLVSATSAHAGTAECADDKPSTGSATRNLAIQKRCSSVYGAALLSVEEVQ